MNNKVWVVTYYDIVYGERQPMNLSVTCFNDKENAIKYYDYILGEQHYMVSIDECEVYTEFKIFE